MSNQSILITGCSSGIGLDAAITLHKRGWQVIATCRQASDCKPLVDAGIEAYALDYSSEASVEEGAARAMDITNGRLFALFNNGAFAIPGAVEDLPRDALRSIFETNLFGQFDLINRIIRPMHQQGEGRIINCSSVLGFAAMKFRGAYNASKFAMEGLTDTLRIENRHSGIDIILIEPGPIATKIRQNSIPHFEQWIDTEQSVHRATYENTLKPRLYTPQKKKDRFELPPSAVTDKLIHALESRRPRPRYYVTVPTHIAGTMKRLLTTRAFDNLTNRR